MLRCVLSALRRRPSSFQARVIYTSSFSHLWALVDRNPQFASVRRFASLEAEEKDSALDKFLKSVNLLDTTVGKRDVAPMELLLRSMDNINTNSGDHAKSQVLDSLEAFSSLINFGVGNLSVQVMLERSVADFYLQKLQQPELAASHYFEALKALPSLSPACVDACDLLQVELLSHVVKCYKMLSGRDTDAEAFFQEAIVAYKQHRQRRGLSPVSHIDALFHKKLDYEVLGLQLGFMEHLLSAKRWDEVGELVEKVVGQIQDTPHLSPKDKLAEIQVIVNQSVEWLAEADKAKPRIAFDIFQSHQCVENLEQLVARRRKINKIWGMDPEDGLELLEREKTLLDEFAEKIKTDDDEKDIMKRAMSSYNLLKAEVPRGCGTCMMALMIASKHFADAQYSCALMHYLEALELFASTPFDQLRREWNMAWVERRVMHIGALCAVASCYQKLNDRQKANLYFVQARDAYNSMCDRVRSRDPSASILVDARAFCPSTDDEERLLSGLALTVASTLVDYAENLASQKDWPKVKDTTDRALQLAEGCTISLHHLKARVDSILEKAPKQ